MKKKCHSGIRKRKILMWRHMWSSARTQTLQYSMTQNRVKCKKYWFHWTGGCSPCPPCWRHVSNMKTYDWKAVDPVPSLKPDYSNEGKLLWWLMYMRWTTFDSFTLKSLCFMKVFWRTKGKSDKKSWLSYHAVHNSAIFRWGDTSCGTFPLTAPYFFEENTPSEVTWCMTP